MKTLLKTLLMGALLSSAATINSLAQGHSENALVKWLILSDPDIWELNKSVTNTHMGVDLFDYPKSGVFVFDLNTTNYTLRSTLLNVIDQDWNRTVYSALEATQTKALGSFGTGTNQFKWPKSLTAHAISDGVISEGFYDVYICDTYNDRVCRYVYTPNSMSLSIGAIMTGNGLWCPIDVTIDNGGTFRPNTDDRIWVLNGHNNLLSFSYDGTLIQSIDLPDDCIATSVVYSQFEERLYVADTADDMIYRYFILPLREGHVVESEVSTTNSVVDLQVDYFGYVWALDSTSRITKYDPYLGPVCYYYEPDQFETTSGFSIALGAGGSPDMYISETWTASSGIQHYVIGTDILDLQVSSSPAENQHWIQFATVDASIVDAAIYEYNNFDAKIKTLADSSFGLAGHTVLLWTGENDQYQEMPTGDYTFRVTSTSIYVDGYTGVPVSEVVKTVNFHHVGPCPDQEVTDPDLDRVCGEDDNCFYIFNPDQADGNGDGIGDACCCIGIRGNVNGDPNEAINLSDHVYLVNFLLRSGPAPACYDEGNVDGSGTINMADLNYLTNLLFTGGPLPPSCL